MGSVAESLEAPHPPVGRAKCSVFPVTVVEFREREAQGARQPPAASPVVVFNLARFHSAPAMGRRGCRFAQPCVIASSPVAGGGFVFRFRKLIQAFAQYITGGITCGDAGGPTYVFLGRRGGNICNR